MVQGVNSNAIFPLLGELAWQSCSRWHQNKGVEHFCKLPRVWLITVLISIMLSGLQNSYSSKILEHPSMLKTELGSSRVLQLHPEQSVMELLHRLWLKNRLQQFFSFFSLKRLKLCSDLHLSIKRIFMFIYGCIYSYRFRERLESLS